MNDRFRFRVWDTDLQSYNDSPDYNVRIEIDQTFGMILTPFHNNIIEMCTGLKDKNGNLIYEGDIVKCDRDFCGEGRVGLIRTVVFSDGAFQIQKINKEDRYYIDAFHNVEIIGNIHEQAEQKDK